MQQYVLSFILTRCEKDNIKEFISWIRGGIIHNKVVKISFSMVEITNGFGTSFTSDSFGLYDIPDEITLKEQITEETRTIKLDDLTDEKILEISEGIHGYDSYPEVRMYLNNDKSVEYVIEFYAKGGQ